MSNISKIFGIELKTIGQMSKISPTGISRFIRSGEPTEPPYEPGDRGVFGGGNTGSYTNVMDYITISTPGNATYFGDLSVGRSHLTACSNSTRGVFGGGWNGVSYYNTMDYVTIDSASSATNFGDLPAVKYNLAACSDGHGGL